MQHLTRRSLAPLAAAAALAALWPGAAIAQAGQSTPPAPKNRALFQVTDNDPARWNLVLGNLQNLRDGMAGEPIEIELVAYGPGVNMLKADSVVKDRIAAAVKAGVKVNACQNTMSGLKLTPADMQGDVGYVPSGVVEVMKKQQQGWAYIRS